MFPRFGLQATIAENMAIGAIFTLAAIQGAARDLLSGAWTDKDGTTLPMRQSDIIVVAPYNAQVNAVGRQFIESVRRHPGLRGVALA